MHQDEYKKTHFGVTIDHDLLVGEIENVHKLWREIRDDEEWINCSWKKFKQIIGLKHDVECTPRWSIENKEKWIWAKLKFNI
jgi:hypothetical protein